MTGFRAMRQPHVRGYSKICPNKLGSNNFSHEFAYCSTIRQLHYILSKFKKEKKKKKGVFINFLVWYVMMHHDP
jgi:hypothetical protein